MIELFKGIKNIIFDFGGVIFTINPQLAVESFKKLGIKNIGETYAELEADQLFDKLEKGNISDKEFRDSIRKKNSLPLTDKQIDDAWCNMLLHFPAENIELLQILKTNFRLFLLSNTCNIHFNYYSNILKNEFNLSFNDLFEKTYFSHLTGLRKPDIKSFLQIVNENRLNPSETLFIDDTYKNIQGAERAGLKTFFLQNNEPVQNIFV